MKHAIRSAATGLASSLRSPKLVLGLWLVNVLAALPLALVMAGTIKDSIGASLFHQTLTEGFDSDWWAEFSAEAGENTLAATFGPTLTGIGAVYDNLEAWWSGRLFTDFPIGLVAFGLAYAVFWAFLLGGVLEALSPTSRRPVRGLATFVAAGGRTLGRFLQLALASGLAYFLIYLLARSLFGWIEDSTGEVTVEQTVFVRVAAVAALTVFLLHLVRMSFDYAKIAVFDGDLSAPRALTRAFAFVISRPLSSLGLYFGFGILSLTLLAVYGWLAPGTGQSSYVSVLGAFLLSQLYLAGRLVLRLALLSAEFHFYRSPAA